MAVRIIVLGATEIDGDSGAASLTRRDRVVLGALTASSGESVTVDQLSDALWGDEPPKSSAKVVQGSVMRLRRALGNDAIETTGAGYRLTLDGDTVDSHMFERLVQRARDLAAVHEPDRAAATYEQALALWRGAPLPELQDWDPGRAEAERLVEVRRSAEEELVEARMDCGLGAAAVADAQHLVRREPYREHRWALLALALYRTGRQREALDAIRRARTTLLDELGLDPGPELVDLEQRILQQDPSLLDVPEAPTAASRTCPWPGLRPFDSDQSEMYAGREADVETCLARLAAYPLLVVVGASGSGKSSLVRAGVAPRLTADGATSLIVAPGATPVATLTTALSSLPDDGVLVVDQLEELFASTRPDDVTAYLDRLADEVAAGRRTIVTLRADYLASLAGSSAFAREAERGLTLLAPMDEAQLREAIEQPAERSGLRLEPGLVDVLLRDVGNDAGGLPLLSHALAETWTHRDGTVLTVEGYRATGGINGAVAQSAERLYESLSSDDRDSLRSVLHRLVTPTPAGAPVAARVPTRVFEGTDDAPRLLDLLVRARLVTTSADSATLAHESLVRAWPRLRTWLDEDVEGQRVFAHLQVAADGWEAGGRPDDELYRGARLVTALEWRERTHPVLAQGELAFLDASSAYADSEERRRAAELAAQKTRNRQLRGALAGVVALLVLSLVAGSLAVVRGRQAQDSAAQAAQAATEADAARLGALSRTGTDLGFSLLTATQAAALSPEPARQADVLAALSRSSVLSSVEGAAPANGGLGDQFSPDGSRLVASQWLPGVSLLDTASGRAVGASPLVTDGDPRLDPQVTTMSIGAGYVDGGRTLAVSSDVAAVSDQSGDLRRGRRAISYWSTDTGRRTGPIEPVPWSLTGEFDRQDLLHISPDGQELVSFADRQVRIWTKSGGRWTGPRRATTPDFPEAIAREDLLHAVSFSDDGHFATVTVQYQGPPTWATLAVILIDLRTARAASDWKVGTDAAAVAPDGRRWAFATLAGVEIMPTTGGSPVRIAVPRAAPTWTMSWSADSRRLALGGQDGSIRVYDVDEVRLLTEFAPDGAPPAAMRLLGAGTTLITARVDGRIDRRSLRGDTPILVVAATPPVAAVAVGPPGTVVAGGLLGGQVAVVDQRSMRLLRTLSLAPYSSGRTVDEPRRMRVTALAVAPDGKTIVAGNRSGTMRMWRTSDGRPIRTIRTAPVEQMAASPDGRWLATIESIVDAKDPGAGKPDTTALLSTTLRLWSLPDLTEVAHHDLAFGSGDEAESAPKGKMLQFSPDSTMIVVPYYDGPLSVFTTDGLQLLSTIDVDDGPGFAAGVFSPDSKVLLGRRFSGSEIRRLDPRTGAQVDAPYPGTEGAPYGEMAFGPDHRWLFSRTPDGLSAYDATTGGQLLNRVSLEPGGFDVADDGGEGSMSIVDDHHLFAATSTGIIRLDIDPSRWQAAACALAGRTLTRDEWSRLLPNRPYTPACTSESGS